MRYWMVGLAILLCPEVAVGQVVINEVAWMGTPVENVDTRQHWRYEFVELLNITDSPISLNGWALELHRDDLDFAIPLWGQIAAGDYFLIGASDKIPEIDINYASLAGKFQNAGQRVVLRDAQGNAADEVDARGGWFAGDNDSKLTMERRFPDRDANDAENWGTSMITGGTPKAENSIFGKEAVLDLTGQTRGQFAQEKKRPVWSPFFDTITNKVFMLAFLLALLSAFLILLLRWYLVRFE